MNKRKDIFDKKILSIDITVDALVMPSVVYELEKKKINSFSYNRTVVHSKSEFLKLAKDLIDSHDKEFFLTVVLKDLKSGRARKEYLQQVFDQIEKFGVTIEKHFDYAKLKKVSIGDYVLNNI